MGSEGVELTITNSPRALDLFRKARAMLQGETVHFDPTHARALCANVPKTFNLHERNPHRYVVIGGLNIVTCPTFGPPMVNDLDRGRRNGSITDFCNFVRLGHFDPVQLNPTRWHTGS